MDLICPDCEHPIGAHEISGCAYLTEDVLHDYGKHCQCKLSREAVIALLRAGSQSDTAAS
jgi:hypothetical protein